MIVRRWDARARRPQRSPGARTGVAGALWLCTLLAGGCEFRDEPVSTAAATGIWTGTGTEGGPTRPNGQPAEVDFVQGYETAARCAATEGRPLLLVFVASWCRWSGDLARGPLADRDVVSRTRRCVCVLVDADRDSATCREFRVEAFPTVIVAEPDGRERFRGTGAAAAAGLAAALDAVPAGHARDRIAAEGPRGGEAKDVTR